MSIESLTLKNYRAFGHAGAELPLSREFVAVVGVNNSGKSTLLRSIYELKPIFDFLAQSAGGSGHVRDLLSPAGLQVPGLRLGHGERVQPTWSGNVKPSVTIRFVETAADTEETIRQVVLNLDEHVLRADVKLHNGREINGGLPNSSNSLGRHGKNVVTGNIGGVPVAIDWEGITLDFRLLSNSMYVGPFRNAVNIGGAPYFDLSIGRDFVTQFDDFKTGGDFNANEAINEMTSRLKAIFNFDDLQINATPDKTALTFMIDGKSMRGSELGAGIAQFVVVAANVLVKKPAILLIDEPELNLHASLQSQFLTLLAEFVTGPVVFSTHSLGLARSSADEVLVTSRDQQGRAQLHPYAAQPNLSLTLGELGYGGLHDTTYDSVLLVEGVSEVKVFQDFLVKLGSRNKVAIVSLGGDNMAIRGRGAELAELRRLADNVFAIVDSEATTADGGASPRRLAFAADCEAQGINCHVLERRATENYLSFDIAKTVMALPEDAAPLGHFDKPLASWSWRKEANWRIATAMTVSDLADTDLGNFLTTVAGT